MEWTSSLPPRLCGACTSSIMDFIPFFVLCRESAQKWEKFSEYLSTLSVNNHAKTAYILLGDEPETVVNRSTNKKSTAKEVVKNLRIQLSANRRSKRKSNSLYKRKGGRNFSCPDCQKGGFEKLYQFNFHLNINKKHCCHVCYDIIDLNQYGSHLASHGLPSFECDICHLHFDRESRLRKHQKYHNRGKFVCPECKYTFKSMEILSGHLSFIHTKVYCVCDKVFHGKGCYFGHKKRMCPKKRTQKYICDYCSKEFTQKGVLSKHIELGHMTTFNEQCDVCGKTFKGKAHLKEHKYMHDKILDRFTCEYCGKNYSTPRGYRKHMAQMHYSVNPDLYKKKKYPCNLCNKVLTSATNLKNHLYRHIQGYPIRCNNTGL